MRRSSRLLSILLSVGVAGGLGVAGPAAAVRQPGWGPVVDVSDPVRYTYGPDLAVDTDGNAVAVWVRGEDRLRLMTASRPEGGAWSSPQTVPGARGAFEAEVAFDGDGDLTVVWSAGRRVQAVRRSAGGSWGEPTTLHRTAAGVRGTRPANLDLAVNARGRAAVSWETMDDDLDSTYARSRVQAVVGGPGAGWSRARTLSTASRDSFAAKIAVSRAGRVAVVWDETTGSSRGQIMTTFRAPGEGWAKSRPLSRLAHPADPQLAALPSGRLAVAWTAVGSEPGITLRRWSPRSGWSRATAVPGVKVDPWWMTIGMDDAGVVTVAWSNQAKAVWVARQTAQGGWNRTRVAPSGSVFYDLQLVVNGAGDAVLGWDGRAGDGHVAQAAYRSRGGSWTAASTLSDPQGDAAGLALCLAGNGTATAAWLFGPRAGSVSRIQARSYGAV